METTQNHGSMSHTGDAGQGPGPVAQPMMSFAQAVKTCFSKYFDFTGRARRSEFWWFVVFAALLGCVGRFLDGMFGWKVGDYQVISGLISIAIFIPQPAESFRRLHDINLSGWWYSGACLFLAFLIALTSQDVLFYLSCPLMFVTCFAMTLLMATDSKRGENKYGPSPKYL